MDSSTGSFKTPQSVVVGIICGLTLLQQQRYREAASVFLKVSPSAVSKASEFSSSQDLALYITLCALVTFSRSELQYLNSADQVFISLSEDAPICKSLIEMLLSSRFKELVKLLNEYTPDFVADPFLAYHVVELVSAIKKRALLQYLSVYRNVKLEYIAEEFILERDQLESLLKVYISEGILAALIDQKNGVCFILI